MNIKTTSQKIVSEKDGGMYEAINKGIRMATGDIVSDFFEEAQERGETPSVFVKQ